jgi:hypothetical protein
VLQLASIPARDEYIELLVTQGDKHGRVVQPTVKRVHISV